MGVVLYLVTVLTGLFIIRPWRYGIAGLLFWIIPTYSLASQVIPSLNAYRNPFLIGVALLSLTITKGVSRTRWPFGVGEMVLYYTAILPLAINLEESFLRVVGLACVALAALNIAKLLASDNLLFAYFNKCILVAFAGGLAIAAVGVSNVSDERRFAVDGQVATGTAVMCTVFYMCFLSIVVFGKSSYRFLSFLALLVSAYLIYRTGTRGALGIVGVLTPLGFFAAGFRVRMNWKLFAVVGLGLALVLVTFNQLRSADSGWQFEVAKFLRLDRSDVLDTRRGLWEVTVEKAWETPIFGRGLGSSNYHYLEDAVFALARPRSRVTVHSQFVEVFYDGGLLCFCLLGFSIIFGLFNVLRIIDFAAMSRRWEYLSFALIYLSFLLGMISHGGFTYTGNAYTLVFWILHSTVCAMSLWREPSQDGVLAQPEEGN